MSRHFVFFGEKNMSIRTTIKEYMIALGVDTYEELGDKIGASKANIEKWIQRKAIPPKWKIILDNLSSSTHKTISVPKLKCTASAGGGNHVEGIDSFEEDGVLVIDRDTLRVNYKNLRAMRVEGHSMVPVLLPDSWVIFDDTDQYVGDGLYVINFRNILMVKMLQVDSEGRLKIVSANKEYESFTIDMDDQSVFKIFGKVRRCII